MSCTIHLIRHGQTDANAAVPPVLQGQGDYALNETGRRQAGLLAAAMEAVPLAAVYSSPLSRARDTAAAVAEPRGLTVRTLDALKEVNVGAWEGLSWDDVLQTDPQTYARVMKNGGDTPYPNGESYPGVAARAVPALLELASRHCGEQIAVVAHRVVNRCVLATLIGLDMRRSKDLPQDNTSHNVLRGDASRLQVVTLNDVSHLGPPTCG